MALLPELLWRWSGARGAALFGCPADTPVPPRSQHYSCHWKDEIWALRTPLGEERLLSPTELSASGDPLNWHPANWYREAWPEMRAFALPSVSDGHIRLNVKGREANGVVPANAFDSEIVRLRAMLEELIDPRTGRKAVSQLITTRSDSQATRDIPADLIVVWSTDPPLDCLQHPLLGRVGPAPYFRSGGHRGHGSTIDNRYILSGGGITPGTAQARDGFLRDLPSTMLALIGAPYAGHSLVSRV